MDNKKSDTLRQREKAQRDLLELKKMQSGELDTEHLRDQDKKIVPKSGSKGWVFKKTHNDGTVERVRYTKTREIREFDGKNGKMTFWSKRK